MSGMILSTSIGELTVEEREGVGDGEGIWMHWQAVVRQRDDRGM